MTGDAPAETPLVRVRVEQVQMGSPFVFTCYAPSEPAAISACRDAGRRVKAIAHALSDYHDVSELNRLCDSYVVGEPVAVSDDLFRVLAAARGVSERSGGAFDATVGPLVKLWRRTRRTGELPDPADLAAARARVGWGAVRLSRGDGNAAAPSPPAPLPAGRGETTRLNGTVTFARPGVRLDLGGIAKGYAADEALAVLRSRGITRALIDAGGDVVAGDPPPGRDGWAVGLGGEGEGTIALANGAVATSGDAYKFTEIDGVRYSHIVDPRTGLGLTDRSTVTVLAPTGMTADALASAVSVLGPAAGVTLLERTDGAEGRVVNEDGVRATSGWRVSRSLEESG